MKWTWNLDPVALSIAGLDVRWYGIAYVVGFFIALHVGHLLHTKITQKKITKQTFENLVFGLFLCGVLGGRLGFFLFYDTRTLFQNPLEFIKVWQGGMSIHGGIFGSIGFLWYWSKKNSFSLRELFDTFVLPLSIALIFGRLANFVNGELVGKPTDQSWGMIFPHIDEQFRHPSQLYAAGKNIINTLILWAAFQAQWHMKPGKISALFCFGYGIQRFIIGFYREPEIVHLGLSMGQWLCLLVIGIGIYLWNTAKQR